jgi:hypothetical protein
MEIVEANGSSVERKKLNRPKSLFKIWNFGVTNAKILPCRLEKSPKIGIFSVYWPQKSTI